MSHQPQQQQHEERQDKEVFEPLPFRLLLWGALWPYFLILTVARYVPDSLGRLRKPTEPPDLRVFLLCAPLALVQLGLASFFFFVLWYDYDRYQRDIGEKDQPLPHKPDEGTTHGVATWLYTRYLEHPWFKPDMHRPDVRLRRAKASPNARTFILRPLPYRRGPRPRMMEGLPQRQLTQLPSEKDTQLLEGMTFHGIFKTNPKIEVRNSPLEGTGALGVRWKEAPTDCPDLQQNMQEFLHQHSFDKSWHVLLAPADACEVLDKGWGERGPPQAVQGMAPPGMCFLYAPRDAEERLVFMDIVAGSYQYCLDTTCGKGGGGQAAAEGAKQK